MLWFIKSQNSWRLIHKGWELFELGLCTVYVSHQHVLSPNTSFSELSLRSSMLSFVGFPPSEEIASYQELCCTAAKAAVCVWISKWKILRFPLWWLHSDIIWTGWQAQPPAHWSMSRHRKVTMSRTRHTCGWETLHGTVRRHLLTL